MSISLTPNIDICCFCVWTAAETSTGWGKSSRPAEIPCRAEISRARRRFRPIVLMSLKPRRRGDERAVACFEKKGSEGGGVALISAPLSPPSFFSSHKNLLTLGRRIKFRLSPFSSSTSRARIEYSPWSRALSENLNDLANYWAIWTVVIMFDNHIKRLCRN